MLTESKPLTFVVADDTDLESPQFVEMTARGHQFLTDITAMCKACRGDEPGVSPTVRWEPNYLKEGAVAVGRFVHPIGDKDWTRCRASEIREASPELNAFFNRPTTLSEEDPNG